MESENSRPDWFSHFVPVATTLLALAMLILTPIWAIGYYQQPFIGVLLEPNNIVSIISGENWPVAGVGARWPNQLTAINGQPVTDVSQVNAILRENGFNSIEITFMYPEIGVPTSVYLEPVRMPLWDFISLFVIPYLVGLVFLLIGLWAYRLRGHSRAGRALLVFAASVSIATTTFFDMNTTHHVVSLWTISLPLAASALIHLALVFPKQMLLVDRWPFTRLISWVLCLVFAVPAVYEIVHPSAPLRYIDTWQACYFFMALAIGLFVAALVWRLFRSDSPVIRQQSRVIVFGAALAFIPMMFFYLLPTALGEPQEFQSSIYFPLMILLPLSITYAILRYRLLDVDRVLANVLSYVLTTGAAVLVFFGLAALISMVINQAVKPDNLLLVALYLLLLVVGLLPLHRLVQRLIDRLFYRSPADYRRVLNTLSSRLVITPNLERILDLLAEQLHQALSPAGFVVYLYDDEQSLYLPHAQGKTVFPPCPADDPLVRSIQNLKHPHYFPPDRDLPEALRASATFQSLGCAVFVPLRYEGTLIGFMALGHKRSGDLYTGDDLEFLDTVAGQSTLALENARLFINLRRTLDQTLEMKNLMDDIFASIATGVITTDVEHKVTLFNRAAENILGISYKDVVGKYLPDALPSCPDLETVAAEAVERGSVVLSREVNRNVPPRGDLYLRLSCSPVRDAYFATKGAAIVVEDLTERRKLQAEQERIRQTFGRVVAPRVRDRLLSDPSHLRLDGTRQPATVLFADISGFTTFSERNEPEVLFRVLNHYLSLAAHAILEEEGTLDKFWGDGVLALWNAPDPQPDHALRAVRAALTIMARTQEAHRLFPDPLHHLHFHIGVATGDVMVGNVGTNELFNYTAIGDTVNVAQRLETIAGPDEIMIDHTTHASVTEKIYAQPLEPVMVKGKMQPVQVYHLHGLKQAG
jgi:PAS domain S-box-containing protein